MESLESKLESILALNQASVHMRLRPEGYRVVVHWVCASTAYAKRLEGSGACISAAIESVEAQAKQLA